MEAGNNYKSHFSGFHDLMGFRVREILLVSSPYDSFVLQEDGRLSERIFSEYLDLNLQFTPRIHQVSTAEEAFRAMQERTYDLVITMTRISDMNPLEFGKLVKEKYPGKPVVLLTYETLGEELTAQIRSSGCINRIFYWSGDSKILLAIIKYVEDLGNIEADTRQGVLVILVVEDSPGYYSQFLPIIYTEIMKQTGYLISHAVNDLHRLLRMRARPKIMLAVTYEEAISIIQRYKGNILGVISDTRFTRGGIMDPEAGLNLAEHVREEISDLPFLLQSEETANEAKAEQFSISFLNKNSPNLLLELRSYILENYGFGDFVFRHPDGREINRAASIADFEKIVKDLPEESFVYHGSRNHFSRWLRARTEFQLADEIKRIKLTDYQNYQEVREALQASLQAHFKRLQGNNITEFGFSRMDLDNSLIRLGSGSIGGKGRGIAFFNSLLEKTDVFNKYSGVNIKIPRTFIVCSGVFEEFLDANGLQEPAINDECEESIVERFLSAPLPKKIAEELGVLMSNINYPLAVRSSSILEDSQTLPFAGLYKTYILPNNHPDVKVRLKQLLDAIRLVYACVFFQSPKHYMRNSDLRIEEEKMAVLIQQLVGEFHGDVFYPVVSGVAQSYNFYPFSYMKPEDGVVSMALGFGKIIVEGGQVYQFSPACPEIQPPYSSVTEFLQKSQVDFYALNLKDSSIQISSDDGCTYEKLSLVRAEQDGVLGPVASTYLPEDDVIRDSIAYPGPRVITFAKILKYNSFPLKDIIKDFFALGRKSFSTNVEIEFAVNIPADKNKDIEFYFLQIRPMVAGREMLEVKVGPYGAEDSFCKSDHTMGNGVFRDLHDLVYVDPDCFEPGNSPRIADEIGEINQQLVNEGRKCIMIGFGRFGTLDPWLGIPLKWNQMSQAKVIIESDLGDFRVEPSLGSHIFHNMLSLKMGYFHIGDGIKAEYLDWDWIKAQPVFRKTRYVRHVRFEQAPLVKIDGRNGTGAIIKP